MIAKWYHCIKVRLANPLRAQLEWTVKVMFLWRSGKHYTTWKKNKKKFKFSTKYKKFRETKKRQDCIRPYKKGQN